MKRILLSAVLAVSFAACASGCCSNATGGTGSSGGSTGRATTSGGASSTGNPSGSSSGSSTGSSSGGTSATTGGGSTTGTSSSGGSSTGVGTGGLIRTLLVDNDQIPTPGGSSGTADPPLTLAEGWLTGAGIPYDVYQEPNDGLAASTGTLDPQDPQLNGIDTIVYVTGDNWGDGDPTVSNAQQTTLQAWLDEGGKSLILLSPGTIDSFGTNSWTTAETNPFLSQYVGLQYDLYDPPWANTVTATEAQNEHTAYQAIAGAPGVPAFAGLQWTLVNDDQGPSPYTHFYSSILQPVAAGVDVLATMPADPTSSGANTAEPVALGHKNMGAKGTSTVVYVAISVENLANDMPRGNVQCDFLNAIQTYAGLVGARGDCGVTVPSGTAASPTLLVDNSFESSPEESPPIFQSWLAGLGGAYATYTEQTSDFADVDTGAPSLAGVQTIVWMSGSNWADGTPVLSYPQEALLGQWLDEGGKTLVLFCPALPSEYTNSWTTPESDVFLTGYLGVQATADNFNVFNAGGDVTSQTLATQIVTGAAGPFSGKQWTVTNNNQVSGNEVQFYQSIVQPLTVAQGATLDVLATVAADPASSGANSAEPIVVGNKHVDALGTSTIVFIGLTVENVSDTVPGMNLQADFLAAVASYAAVP